MPIITPFGPDRDTYYLNQALALARKAGACNEVPVGAVVVNSGGHIVGRGYNQVERKHTQAAHAEVLAINRAGNRVNDWRLEGHWIYVTLEPCGMCLNLIRLSRCEGVVFGAASPLFGRCLDKSAADRLYKDDVLILQAEEMAAVSAHLLRQFFQQKRVQE